MCVFDLNGKHWAYARNIYVTIHMQIWREGCLGSTLIARGLTALGAIYKRGWSCARGDLVVAFGESRCMIAIRIHNGNHILDKMCCSWRLCVCSEGNKPLVGYKSQTHRLGGLFV